MHNFDKTRVVFIQVKEFKNYMESKKDASMKERDFYEVIFRYLMGYILFAFDCEADSFKEEMIDYYKVKNKKSKDEINEKLDIIFKEKTELNAKYKNFIEERNRLAHSRKASFLTWEDYINIELQDCPDKLDIVELGEKVLKLVHDKLRESLKE